MSIGDVLHFSEPGPPRSLTAFTLDPAHRDEELARVRLLSRALAARERFTRLTGTHPYAPSIPGVRS